MKRALRRHHITRLKRKRSAYWAGHAGDNRRFLGIAAHTPKTCSCWMCGNVRKYRGKTIQERKLEVKYYES